MSRVVELQHGIERFTVAPVTPGNENLPTYIGHEDGLALHNDYGANIAGRDTSVLGTTLKPLARGATRESVFQLNHGGSEAANVKAIVRNVFAYKQEPDDHHPPASWGEFRDLFRTQDRYSEEVMGEHPDTYMTVTTQEGLVVAMKTDGRIAIFKSVEGMPQHIEVPPWKAANTLVSACTQVVDLMWNHNTDVGDSHTTSEDNGLTPKGAELIMSCADYGVPVFDVSHASPRTAMDMIRLIGPNRRVIASHTGARIGNVAEKTRNITDEVARAIFEREGIVGVATAGGMLGGNTLEHVVAAVRHFVELDPTGGKLVTLGHDLNGLGVESMIKGAETALNLNNIAGALADSGFSDETVKDILLRNAYNFWYSALEDVKKPA